MATQIKMRGITGPAHQRWTVEADNWLIERVVEGKSVNECVRNWPFPERSGIHSRYSRIVVALSDANFTPDLDAAIQQPACDLPTLNKINPSYPGGVLHLRRLILLKRTPPPVLRLVAPEESGNSLEKALLLLESAVAILKEVTHGN